MQSDIFFSGGSVEIEKDLNFLFNGRIDKREPGQRTDTLLYFSVLVHKACNAAANPAAGRSIGNGGEIAKIVPDRSGFRSVKADGIKTPVDTFGAETFG